MPHGITQCYLPPGRGDIPALNPAEAGTRLSDPGGMQGWVVLCVCSFDVTGRRCRCGQCGNGTCNGCDAAPCRCRCGPAIRITRTRARRRWARVATWRIRLNDPCAAAMRPCSKLLWPSCSVIDAKWLIVSCAPFALDFCPHIWGSYEQEFTVLFFWLTVYFRIFFHCLTRQLIVNNVSIKRLVTS